MKNSNAYLVILSAWSESWPFKVKWDINCQNLCIYFTSRLKRFAHFVFSRPVSFSNFRLSQFISRRTFQIWITFVLSLTNQQTRSVTPFQGGNATNAGHLITTSVSFTATTSTKTNHQMTPPGLVSCVLILVVLVSKCYTVGMFFLLF